MCGICGVIGGGGMDLAESQVRRMLHRLVHRGPDDEGLLSKPRAALGMRRLSIIDIEGGHQPVYNEDGMVCVVFNGEIYNFRELRESLEQRGHRFRSRSDTEVIVHSYEEWGEQCCEHFRGMFAIAIWDGRGAGQNGAGGARVLLARDRLGIKPLYYSVANGILLFASEVRALLASEAIARRIAAESVEAYLLFGSVVEPMTLVEGVFSLPPGHSMMVSCEAPASAKPSVYWDLPASAYKSESRAPTSLHAAAAAVRPLLEDAVRSRLIADVPLGIFLSSGLDSTALAALAARERSNVQTFTVAFAEQEFSEAALARETAHKLGTEHHELMLTSEEMLAQLRESVDALDQPSMDGINTYFVSWAAHRAGLKVALSGLGGDEIFGGYPTFQLTPRVSAFGALARCVPSPLRNLTSKGVLAMSRRARHAHRSDLLRKAEAIWSQPQAMPHPYFFTRMLFTPRQVELLFSTEAFARLGQGAASSPWRNWLSQVCNESRQFSGDSEVSWLELRSYTLNTLLRDTDSMSMRHSLEVRVPLLDHHLVESVMSLPTSAKRRKGVSKALLVEALDGLLPEEIVRQPKRGFTFPWQRWLRGPLGLDVALRLGRLTPSMAEVLDRSLVQSVWRSFLMDSTGWARPWSLYVLNEWVRRNLDEAEPQEEPARSFVAKAADSAIA